MSKLEVSAELRALAKKIAALPPPKESLEEWAARLARDLAKFED